MFLFRPSLIRNKALYPDHTRDGVKYYTITFYPALFTPFLM